MKQVINNKPPSRRHRRSQAPQLLVSRVTHLVFLLLLSVSLSSLPTVHSLILRASAASAASADVDDASTKDNVPQQQQQQQQQQEKKKVLTTATVAEDTTTASTTSTTTATESSSSSSTPFLDPIPVMYNNHWGRSQLIQGPNRTEIVKILEQTEEYMTHTVYVLPEYNTIRQDCINRNVLCTFWAAAGWCQSTKEEDHHVWSK
jgi:hypothetical protein